MKQEGRKQYLTRQMMKQGAAGKRRKKDTAIKK